MLYPGVGIPLSTTGSAWGTSLTAPASALVGISDTQALTNKTLTSPTLTTPVLGTPASGNLTNCTFPTLNQNTTGSAGSATLWGAYASIASPRSAATYTFPASSATMLYSGGVFRHSLLRKPGKLQLPHAQSEYYRHGGRVIRHPNRKVFLCCSQWRQWHGVLPGNSRLGYPDSQSEHHGLGWNPSPAKPSRQAVSSQALPIPKLLPTKP